VRHPVGVAAAEAFTLTFTLCPHQATDLITQTKSQGDLYLGSPNHSSLHINPSLDHMKLGNGPCVSAQGLVHLLE